MRPAVFLPGKNDCVVRRPNQLIVCDNLLWGGRVAEGVRDASTDALQAFNRRITTDPRLTTTIVAVGDGLGVLVVN